MPPPQKQEKRQQQQPPAACSLRRRGPFVITRACRRPPHLSPTVPLKACGRPLPTPPPRTAAQALQQRGIHVSAAALYRPSPAGPLTPAQVPARGRALRPGPERAAAIRVPIRALFRIRPTPSARPNPSRYPSPCPSRCSCLYRVCGPVCGRSGGGGRDRR